MLWAALKDLTARRRIPPPTPTVSPRGPLEDPKALEGLVNLFLERFHVLEVRLRQLHTSMMIELAEARVRGDARYAEPKRLLRHAWQVNSQNGEDGILREIFRRIGTTDRVFAEIGVEDGTECNTAFLLSQGWSGFWFDGSDAFAQSLKDRADLDGALRHAVAFVTRESVAPLFREIGVPVELDLLSLDIDQNTYYVWEALRDYRPRVVVVEYNAALPPDLDWKVRYRADRRWNGSQNFGASLKALENLASELGYCLVGCDPTGANAFFVRRELVGDKFAAPFTAENHYEPPRYAFLHRRLHRSEVLDRA